MKRILTTVIVVAGFLLSLASCSLDKRPSGVIDPDNAFQSFADAQKLRTGLYMHFRGTTTGAVASSPEIQSDLFHATVNYGNTGGFIYGWQFVADEGTVTDLWSGRYGNMKHINYFIEHAEAIAANEDNGWKESELKSLDIYIGEAYFLRAYNHFQLADRFCLSYAGNENEYGIPYIKEYRPTSDQSKYPSRGTLEETFRLILEDIKVAEEKITTAGSLASIYITSDAVKALKARVALSMGDYETAILCASELTTNSKYALVSTMDDFTKMWVNDSGSECIMQLDAKYSESLPPSNDYMYIGYDQANNVYKPGYIPTQRVVDLFGEYPEDFRNKEFIVEKTMEATGAAKYDVKLFYKFQGNPELRGPSSWNYVSKAKPFRIAEQYLILAEAYARSGQDGLACKALNDLRLKRIPEYTDVTLTGEALLTEILEERVRELMGEGFRLSDLKRFGVNVVRGAAQVADAIYLPSVYEDFEMLSGNYRFVWPIPQEELDANPQIKGEQNPGY